MEAIKTDILIIGAGGVGCAIARELSRYKFNITVLEKECDVAAGTSGRNSAVVHAGFNNKPGSLMASLCVEGKQMPSETFAETIEKIGSAGFGSVAIVIGGSLGLSERVKSFAASPIAAQSGSRTFFVRRMSGFFSASFM